ncbi:ABC transporter permease [Jannaschia aquimarina]|uniref:YdcV_2 protein n=1 Tax=Jannaschia aquimarina TaxID=935700 RepID=A0A0D1DAZ0_9RHOB|nr:ABC transporter permease [Jannaschia aquimarina]KIT17108.1 Inner membrane ABC transporter permease protein YdcV [Jannaschia aquimarina]SNS46998.1 spermidine/putrescine transport system permease protein [Jannaschia aquimarina]
MTVVQEQVDIVPVRAKGRRRSRNGLGARLAWGGAIAAILAFLYLPIAVLVLFSFNSGRLLSWPIQGFTLDWYRKLASNEQLIEAAWNSLYVATCSTALTLIIGVPAALALDRLSFPGKGLFRKLVLLPIALPGIITGISMLTLFRLMGANLSLTTVIIGHATALLAVVVTQVYARLQRLPRSYEEASADLGASGLQTFFFVTLPNIRTAVIGSGLLSFTLSFDEIPVTFFLTGRDNTLPMYIWSTMRRGLTPEINAVGALIVLASAVLVVLSVLLLRDKPGGRA